MQFRMDKMELTFKNFFTELWGENSHQDVTLVTDEDFQIKAHLMVLAAGSKFFRKIFKSMSNQAACFIFLKGVQRADLQLALTFLYSGEITIPNNEVNRFMNIAEYLQMDGISLNNLLTSATEKGNSSSEKVLTFGKGC